VLYGTCSPFAHHAFLKGRSTTANILEFVTNWIFATDAHHNIDLLFIDLTETFDSMIYSKHISKLSRLSIGDKLLDWIRRY